MGVLNEVYEITLQMDTLIPNPNNLDRTELIELLNRLLDEREALLQNLSGPYADEEKEIGKKLLVVEERVTERMQALFGNVKRDLQQLKQQKKSNKSYINPYGNMKTTDGVYLDSKQ